MQKQTKGILHSHNYIYKYMYLFSYVFIYLLDVAICWHTTHSDRFAIYSLHFSLNESTNEFDKENQKSLYGMLNCMRARQTNKLCNDN